MHGLVFKRLEVPNMEEKEVELYDKECEGGSGDLFTKDDDCQSCNWEASTVQTGMSVADRGVLPHSSTCSYGIQALINNVHRGYVNEGENDADRTSTKFREEESSQLQESEILRQWRRKKEAELEERERESQAKQDHILEQAAIERENFYKERKAQIEAKKRLNREKEMKYHADVEAKQKLVEGNLWEAVASLIGLNGEVDGKTANSSGKSPKSIVELSTPRTHESKRPRDTSPKPTKKTADLSRMREILLKLQHQALVRG
ncbi:hypothetical protein KC19_1G163500 [Ceratodon purpureus]|uniref:Clathrin light chain n=1 Tax=Ceratodon purpureus TaxID=3225 RepID=A0A8T0J8S4_CERPU|nr:hypothetical protein KC19_1G163500 [Ceratodon purpureus]